MGIVNLTPDSFSDGGRFDSPEAAVTAALALEAAGASVLDLGAESSRPGSEPISIDEELARLMPVLAKLRPQTDLPISVDTTKARVAGAALEAGADWINDISALRADPDMARTIADSGAALVLMHMLGEPKTMQHAPDYADCLAQVQSMLLARVDAAIAAGISRDRLLIDPGIGFGKRLEDNCALIRGLPTLVASGLPVLLGASRKSFLGELLGSDGRPPRPAPERDVATVAIVCEGWRAGVAVHRAHNVRYAIDALRTLAGLSRKDE